MFCSDVLALIAINLTIQEIFYLRYICKKYCQALNTVTFWDIVVSQRSESTNLPIDGKLHPDTLDRLAAKYDCVPCLISMLKFDKLSNSNALLRIAVRYASINAINFLINNAKADTNQYNGILPNHAFYQYLNNISSKWLKIFDVLLTSSDPRIQAYHMRAILNNDQELLNIINKYL